MKKIVALVLCLVLALSLCTVAFADSKTLDLEDDYKFMSMDNTYSEALPEDGELTYYAESVTTKTVDGETTKTVTPAYYLYEYESGTMMMGIVTHEDAANIKLVAGKKVVAFLYVDDSKTITSADGAEALADSAKTSDTAVKVGTEKDDAECGEFKGVNDATIYEIDDEYYTIAGDGDAVAKTALLSGEVCLFADYTEDIVEHNFDATKVNSKDGTVTSIYCDNCEKYVAVIKASKVPANDVNDYEFVTKLDNKYVYLKLATPVASTDSSSTTVESAKTFDAGIALYAGMALASVAGSAVVIGKKKEF